MNIEHIDLTDITDTSFGTTKIYVALPGIEPQLWITSGACSLRMDSKYPWIFAKVKGYRDEYAFNIDLIDVKIIEIYNNQFNLEAYIRANYKNCLNVKNSVITNTELWDKLRGQKLEIYTKIGDE